jgi:hypothetical protein
MYYAAENSYATDTSVGFANTWGAVGFPTKRMRDVYVVRATDMTTRSIKASELKRYGGKRGQVSYYDDLGRYHVHMGHGEFSHSLHSIDPVTSRIVTDACGIAVG